MVRPRLGSASRRARHDLVVMDDGLLITPVTGRRYGVLAAMQSQYLRGNLVRRAEVRLQALFDAVDGDPRSFVSSSPGSRWIPWSSVARASRGGGAATGRKLRLALADGSNLKIVWTTYTTELGPVWDTLGSALGDRWGKVR